MKKRIWMWMVVCCLASSSITSAQDRAPGATASDDAILESVEPIEPVEPEVPLKASFSRAEQVMIWSLMTAGGTAYLLSDPIALSLGGPRWGPPGSLDIRVSNALYRGPDTGKWLLGIPDELGGLIAPALSLGWYGADALLLKLNRSLTGDRYAVHEFMAFAEAYSVSLTATMATKFLARRERPLYALERVEDLEGDPDRYLSFFSGHASSSFTIAAFAARDLSDWLVSQVLTDASNSTRLWVGRVLPMAGLYGMATVVGVSRVIDQKHYLSDVLVGTTVGLLAGNLFYARHFDRLGRVRVRNSSRALSLALVPTLGGARLVGVF